MKICYDDGDDGKMMIVIKMHKSPTCYINYIPPA